jgi:hypothetical protein
MCCSNFGSRHLFAEIVPPPSSGPRVVKKCLIEKMVSGLWDPAWGTCVCILAGKSDGRRAMAFRSPAGGCN